MSVCLNTEMYISFQRCETDDKLVPQFYLQARTQTTLSQLFSAEADLPRCIYETKFSWLNTIMKK